MKYKLTERSPNPSCAPIATLCRLMATAAAIPLGLSLGFAALVPAATAQSVSVAEYPQVPTPLALVCEEEFDRSGYVWIEEVVAGKMAKLNTNTGQITEYPVDGFLQVPGFLPVNGGIELGWDGGIWFSTIATNQVVRLDPATARYSYYNIPSPGALSLASLPGTLQSDDMTKGADGAMWFTEPGINAIGRIDLKTHLITSYQIPTPDVPVINGIGFDGVFHIITHGPNNTVVFNEPFANKIGTLNVFTKQFVEYPVPTPAALPIGMAETADGSIWFTEATGGKIASINTVNGVVTEYSVAQLRIQFSTVGLGNPVLLPGSLKLGSDGNLYFGEGAGGGPTATNILGEYNPTTGQFTEIAVPTPLSTPGCDLNNQVVGNVLFGESTGNRVGVLTAGPEDPASVKLLNYWNGFNAYQGPPNF